MVNLASSMVLIVVWSLAVLAILAVLAFGVALAIILVRTTSLPRPVEVDDSSRLNTRCHHSDQ